MSAIPVRPIGAAASRANHFRKLQKPIEICVKTLGFGGQFGCRKSVSWVSRRRTWSTIMVSNGEGFHDLKQETSSVEEPLSFGADGLEATLNSWRYGINNVTSILGGTFFIIGYHFSWLRVSQQLHTLSQVIVGAVIGSIFSILWFWSWYSLVLDCFMSLLWVRVVVILGAAGFSSGFLHHLIHCWSVTKRQLLVWRCI